MNFPKFQLILAVAFILPLGAQGWAAGCGIGLDNSTRQIFRFQSLVHKVHLMIGVGPQGQPIPQPLVVPNWKLSRAPYNAVLKVRSFDAARQGIISCTSAIVGDPHILVTSRHCAYQDYGQGAFVPNLFGLFGIAGRQHSKWHMKVTESEVCEKTSGFRGRSDPAHDFVVFYLTRPFPERIQPFKIVRRPDVHCSSGMNELAFMPELDKRNLLYQVHGCHRYKKLELNWKDQFPFGVPIVSDCDITMGSSGAPLYCDEPSASGRSLDHVFYGMASSEQGYRHHTHFAVGFGGARNVATLAVPPSAIINAVLACMRKHHIPLPPRQNFEVRL